MDFPKTELQSFLRDFGTKHDLLFLKRANFLKAYNSYSINAHKTQSPKSQITFSH